MDRRKPERHPRITALRALSLLERLAEEGRSPCYSLLQDIKQALREHVAAELTRRSRRSK